MSLWRTDLLAIAIIFIVYIYRLILYATNYPDLNTADPSIEYLVMDHMVRYGEFPWVGTTAFQGAAPINSALYYYVLSPFLLLYNSASTLNVVNITGQAFMTWCIYLIIKKLITPNIALLAIILVSFSQEGMKASRFFFQPYIMQPIFFLSILLLVRGYLEKSSQLVMASVVAFGVSLAMYLSSIAYLPLYVVGVWGTIRQCKDPIYKAIGALMTFLITGLISFGTVIGVIMTRRTFTTFDISNLLSDINTSYASRLSSYLQLHHYTLFPANGVILAGFPLSNILGLIMGLLSVVFFASRRSLREKYIAAGLLILALPPILVTPLFHMGPSDHYLHISLLFSLLYSAIIIGRTLFSHQFLIPIGILFTLIFMYSSSLMFRFAVPLHYPVALEATDAIRKEVDMLQSISSEPLTFSITRLKTSIIISTLDHSINPDFLFWQLLEQTDGMKYIPINPYLGLPDPPNEENHLFLVCSAVSMHEFEISNAECLPHFVANKPYAMRRKIFSTYPFTIYLMYRNDI